MERGIFTEIVINTIRKRQSRGSPRTQKGHTCENPDFRVKRPAEDILSSSPLSKTPWQKDIFPLLKNLKGKEGAFRVFLKL